MTSQYLALLSIMVLPLKQGVSSGDLDGTAVCGVNLILARRNTMMFQRAGMLAPDGRCKTLDASADGYVRAEGCEVVMLAAGGSGASAGYSVALGGSAVNQDGRSSSLTAPNGPSQQDVIGTALRDGSVSAADVMSLQMHGTGTSLGDPIEMGGLLGVLGGSEGSRTLVLGAIKSSVGHAECAAGAAGLMHAASTLCNKLVVGVMHLRGVNPHVSNAIEAADVGGSVALPKASHSRASDAAQQRRAAAGVSSFAFQGTNAHAVVCEGNAARVSASKRSVTIVEQRFWVGPLSLALAVRAVPVMGSSRTRFEIHTGLGDSPLLSSMLDHCVRGRALFPAAGFLEVVSQAGAVMTSGASTLTLQGVAISSPLLLKSGTQPSVISVGVDAVTGHFTIQEAGTISQNCSGRFGSNSPSVNTLLPSRLALRAFEIHTTNDGSPSSRCMSYAKSASRPADTFADGNVGSTSNFLVHDGGKLPLTCAVYVRGEPQPKVPSVEGITFEGDGCSSDLCVRHSDSKGAVSGFVHGGADEPLFHPTCTCFPFNQCNP